MYNRSSNSLRWRFFPSYRDLSSLSSTSSMALPSLCLADGGTWLEACREHIHLLKILAPKWCMLHLFITHCFRHMATPYFKKAVNCSLVVCYGRKKKKREIFVTIFACHSFLWPLIVKVAWSLKINLYVKHFFFRKIKEGE